VLLYDLSPAGGTCPDRLRRLGARCPVGVPRAWLAPVGTPYPTTCDEAALTWRPGLDGLRFAQVGDLPPLSAWARLPAPSCTVPVDLGEAGTIQIEPAHAVGWQIDLLAGTVGEHPASRYGRLVVALVDRLRSGDPVATTDQDLLAVAVAALQTGYRLSEEAIHLYGLLTTRTVWALLEAAYGLPKAQPAASG
jgi:hypothetical protein